ncbi:MAG: PDZ domain-containing protein [Gemmatimonadales bacterium]
MSRLAPLLLSSLLIVARVPAAEAQQDGGLPRRPYFGAQVGPVPAPQDSAHPGIQVIRVLPGSPASVALTQGDVILRLNQQPVTGVPQFLALLRRQRTGAPLPVELRRGDSLITRTLTLAELPREQGEGYTVTYAAVGPAGARHRVIITQPVRSALAPAVMLIGGIGCYSVDNPLAAPDAYLQILQGLTARGYVTMRVEKSGIGDSEGDCPTQDFEQELAGYIAGARYLRALPYVDSSRIYLFGHSIGGVADPLVAARVPVRGVIAMASVVQPWFDYELENTRRQLTLGGANGPELERAVETKRACMQRLLLEREDRARILADRPECAGYMQYPASDRYVQQVAALDLRKAWAAVDTRVLAISPAADFISGWHDHEEIAAIVNQAHPGRATAVSLPETDHYFQRVPDQAASFALVGQGVTSQSFNPAVIALLGDWLSRQG